MLRFTGQSPICFLHYLHMEAQKPKSKFLRNLDLKFLDILTEQKKSTKAYLIFEKTLFYDFLFGLIMSFSTYVGTFLIV